MKSERRGGRERIEERGGKGEREWMDGEKE